jgi:hypothetical protein
MDYDKILKIREIAQKAPFNFTEYYPVAADTVRQ